MKFISIKQSHFETDLLILKGRLEAEGIKCHLKNEFTTQIMSHMGTFGVELQVLSCDLARAREKMAESAVS